MQLNDTHPSLAVTELMPILCDLHNFRWDESERITVELPYQSRCCREALEPGRSNCSSAWSAPSEDHLPHQRVAHLALARCALSNDVDFRASVSLIDEKSGRRVRMGQLAFVGSHRINGVSAMHSDLMKETVFHDLNHLYPGRITNKTNGITFRRWLMLANPKLTDLLREACGEAVLDDPSQLELLEARASDNAFQQQFRGVKHHNKIALARLIGERLNVKVDPAALFDVQIKRIHEYKRQLLNILETVALYHAIKDEPQRDWVPRKDVASQDRRRLSHRQADHQAESTTSRVVNKRYVVSFVAPEGSRSLRAQCQALPRLPSRKIKCPTPTSVRRQKFDRGDSLPAQARPARIALERVRRVLTIGTLDGANHRSGPRSGGAHGQSCALACGGGVPISTSAWSRPTGRRSTGRGDDARWRRCRDARRRTRRAPPSRRTAEAWFPPGRGRALPSAKSRTPWN